MSKKIRNYNELIAEKQRLKQLLVAQKALIKEDVNELKLQFRPVQSVFSFIGKMASKDKSNPLLSSVTDTFVDVVVKRLLLTRAGWVSKLVIPFITKNLSSHLVSDNKETILRKLLSWIKPTSKKKKNTIEPDDMAE